MVVRKYSGRVEDLSGLTASGRQSTCPRRSQGHWRPGNCQDSELVCTMTVVNDWHNRISSILLHSGNQISISAKSRRIWSTTFCTPVSAFYAVRASVDDNDSQITDTSKRQRIRHTPWKSCLSIFSALRHPPQSLLFVVPQIQFCLSRRTVFANSGYSRRTLS